MPWSAPTFTGGVVWQDAPSENTPLNAADLNTEENAEAAYAAQVGQSVANYVDAETARAETVEATLIPFAQKGVPGGVMALDGGGRGAQPPKLHASTHAPSGSDPLPGALVVSDSLVDVQTKAAAALAVGTPYFYAEVDTSGNLLDFGSGVV